MLSTYSNNVCVVVSAADEAHKAKAAAEEIARLKTHLQNVQLKYNNTTNLHRETHVRTIAKDNLSLHAASCLVHPTFPVKHLPVR